MDLFVSGSFQKPISFFWRFLIQVRSICKFGSMGGKFLSTLLLFWNPKLMIKFGQNFSYLQNTKKLATVAAIGFVVTYEHFLADITRALQIGEIFFEVNLDLLCLWSLQNMDRDLGSARCLFRVRALEIYFWFWSNLMDVHPSRPKDGCVLEVLDFDVDISGLKHFCGNLHWTTLI